MDIADPDRRGIGVLVSESTLGVVQCRRGPPDLSPYPEQPAPIIDDFEAEPW
jgi:hypothetical protein